MLLALAALATACGGASTPTATPDGPVADTVIRPILATTVLRTGTQRVAFLLEAETRLVSAPTATVTSTFLDGEAPGETKVVTFRGWPFGTRGSYAGEFTFPKAGRWRLDIRVDDPSLEGELVLSVDETSRVADVGELAPFSNNKTLESVGGELSKLTTHANADPELYQTVIAESLFSGRPGVIVFASPAFCTSPTCGPQVETVIELKEVHRGEADFIHVEVYENPDEIQGDLSRGVFTPLLAEWGIDSIPNYVNESWVFVLGADGRIASRFEGFATLSELEEALLAAR
ncbi:MAG: thioredoxin family protein [Dehalococcoidia bacterium]